MVRWFENSCTGCGCETESKGVAKTKSGFILISILQAAVVAWKSAPDKNIFKEKYLGSREHGSVFVSPPKAGGNPCFFCWSFFLEFFFLFRQRATLDACFYAISERNAARKNRKNPQIQGFFLWEVFFFGADFPAAPTVLLLQEFQKTPAITCTVASIKSSRMGMGGCINTFIDLCIWNFALFRSP